MECSHMKDWKLHTTVPIIHWDSDNRQRNTATSVITAQRKPKFNQEGIFLFWNFDDYAGTVRSWLRGHVKSHTWTKKHVARLTLLFTILHHNIAFYKIDASGTCYITRNSTGLLCLLLEFVVLPETQHAHCSAQMNLSSAARPQVSCLKMLPGVAA